MLLIQKLNALILYYPMEKDVVRKILAKIDGDPTISQKRMAEEIGISVGMINWHVKRCTAKGLIKLQHAPMRRYLYYLTPAGFSEKAELTAQYLQTSFNIFRVGREQYINLFSTCRQNGWRNVALLGKSELTELARMVATNQGDIKICVEIDPPNLSQENISSAAAVIDAVIVTHFFTQKQSFEDCKSLISNLKIDQNRLLIPEFLL